ncbi:Hypothetical predicted protein [Octopus vulgaris]|uniref:Uncharacterized protein n=1 Tax=Octopus vulgaris TaxID=6645 RepID=A0AA36AK55_OCTVU|nr:Hypothetical predicted protein [Octopus vulgaris]
MLFSFNMAAGNVRGAMRPQGRSPSFFIVGLFLAVGILGFNYWSLSKRNHDLATQLLNMQDQLRLCISKRMTVERRGSNIVNELKKCETALDMDKNEVARKESEVITLTEQLKIKDVQISSHEAKVKEMEELRMNLKTCEENNSGIVQELQKKKEELKANQPTGVNAETCKACKDQWVFDQKAFLNGIDKVLGPTALLQLKNAGVDIGNYALEISAQLKNSQMQNNEAQPNLPSKNMSVSQPAGNQAAVPAETGQNAGAAGGNTILGMNSANNVNQGTNNKEVIAAPNSNDNKAGGVENQAAGAPPINKDVAGGNPGAAVPPTNNNVVSGNPGAVVLPADNAVGGNPGAGALPPNNDVPAGNPGAVVPPVNNDIAGENPGAGVPPANNDVAGGNQGAVVPPAINNDGGAPVNQDVGAGDPKIILPQNNDAAIGNLGPVVPLLNNNNEGGDGVGNGLDGVIGMAEKLKEQDVAGGKLTPTEPSHINGMPAGAAFNDNFIINQPKIESKEPKTGLLDILKNNNILLENQYKTAPSINNPNLLAAQDGVNALKSLKEGFDNMTGSSINITKPGVQTPSQLSNNTAFSIKASNAVLSPVSSSDKGYSLLAVKSNKTDSSDPGPGSPQMKSFNNSNLIKYLQTNSSGVNALKSLKEGFDSMTGSSINITKPGVQTPSQLSNNTAFSIKASNAVLSPVSSSDKGYSLLAVKSNKTDSSDPGPGSPQMKSINNSNLIKYLQTNSSGPNSNMKEDNLKVGFNTIEDSIDKMQKSMTLDDDKMNSLEKGHS